MTVFRFRSLLLIALAAALVASPSWADETATADKKAEETSEAKADGPKKPKPIPYTSGIPWAEPEHVEPGARNSDPPSDAVVLFDGTNLDAWEGQTDKWIFRHGYAIAGGRIRTKQAFGDCQLHLEFQSPIEDLDSGQGKGNNGVGLMDAKYEIQILDSYENETYYDGQAAAVYKQHPPLVNASRPTGQWQTYDIIFTAPKFNDDGSLQSPAYVTVLHNGLVVQNHYELKGDTPFMVPPSYKKHPERLPLVLYYHTDPVRFRNIWIRDLSGDAGKAQLQETASDNAGEKMGDKKGDKKGDQKES